MNVYTPQRALRVHSMFMWHNRGVISRSYFSGNQIAVSFTYRMHDNTAHTSLCLEAFAYLEGSLSYSALPAALCLSLCVVVTLLRCEIGRSDSQPSRR